MCSRTWKSLNTLFGISLCVITVCLLEKSTILGIINHFLRVFIVVSLSRHVISQGYKVNSIQNGV